MTTFSPRHNPPFWQTKGTCVVAIGKNLLRVDLDGCYMLRNGYDDIQATWGSTHIDTQEARELVKNLIQAIRDAESYDHRAVAPLVSQAPTLAPTPAPLLFRK